ncbi:hypothetical protein HYS31_08250 [Candidatus Woesearchaeota archaeon]|nr:hypothetical protein [Candidatus Woesearchaeota archaeon]
MRKLSLFVFLFFILLVNACAKQQSKQSEDVSILTPEQVVALYFQAWNDEQYNTMYSLISEGFKQIEPTANTFEDFKANMEKFYDTANSIRLLDANEEYKNDNEAGVSYTIEIENKDGTKKEFSSTYTLKKRANGWKLIHPYGKNIDTT